MIDRNKYVPSTSDRWERSPEVLIDQHLVMSGFLMIWYHRPGEPERSQRLVLKDKVAVQGVLLELEQSAQLRRTVHILRCVGDTGGQCFGIQHHEPHAAGEPASDSIPRLEPRAKFRPKPVPALPIAA